MCVCVYILYRFSALKSCTNANTIFYLFIYFEFTLDKFFFLCVAAFKHLSMAAAKQLDAVTVLRATCSSSHHLLHHTHWPRCDMVDGNKVFTTWHRRDLVWWWWWGGCCGILIF